LNNSKSDKSFQLNEEEKAALETEIDMLGIEEDLGIKQTQQCKVKRINSHQGCQYLSQESIELIQVMCQHNEIAMYTACMCMSVCENCGGSYNSCARNCMKINNTYYSISDKLAHEVTCQKVPLTQEFVERTNDFSKDNREVIKKLNTVRLEEIAKRKREHEHQSQYDQWDSDDF
jgi:hypothetical protein